MDIAELSDIQSESGVIGTLIYHPEFIAHTDYLKPNYFYGQENACIYWAIQELCHEGIDNIDAYNISNKIHSHKGVQKALDKYNLPSVQEWVELYKSTARHTLKEYKMLAETITTYAYKRDLIKVSNQINKECFDKTLSLEQVGNKAYGHLDDLTQKYITTTEIHTLGEDIDDIWNEIVQRRTEDGLYGIPSKFKSFSEYFTYEPGELIMLQAKYKQGKSAFLMNEVVHKLKNGVPVLVVDREMPTRLYAERLISHLSGVSVKRVKNGDYSEEDGIKIMKCCEWLKKQPFVHRYEPNLSFDSLYSLCKMLQNKIGLGFLVYDYLKSNETSSSDNYNVLGAKCDFLKNNIAGELDIPVLSACQLNRGDEVADSIKINMYTSVAIKWGHKTQEMIAKDGIQSGNMYAKIYVNRLGKQMDENDDNEYIDFKFSGDTMTIVEAEQHDKTSAF